MSTDIRQMVSPAATGQAAEHAIQRQLLALEALSTLARQFATDPDFKRLLSTFLLTVSGQFSVNCAAIFLPGARVKNDTTGHFVASGAMARAIDAEALNRDIVANQLALSDVGCLVLREDNTDCGEAGSLLDRLYQAGARVVATLKNGADTVGLVCLSEKVTKQPFTDDDLRLLETISNALTPLISNSLLFAQISDLNEWYLKILNSVKQGVFVFDSQGLLQKVNAAGMAMLRTLTRANTSSELLLGQSVETVFPAAVFPGWAVRVRVGSRRGGHRVLENSIARCNNVERIFSLRFSYVNDVEKQENNVIVMVDDVTGQRQSEQRMFELQKFAEKGIMASSIAHEMNNFLGLILGGVELGQIAMKKGNMERLGSTLEKLKNNVKKMERFTAGLTDFTKLNTTKEDANINDVVADVISFSAVQRRFKGLEIKTDLDPHLPHIELDKDQIAQLLLNFMNNAADAIAEADRGDDGIISIKTSHTEHELSFAVTDNGVGIDPAIKDTLFKVHMTTKEKGHGYGLVTCAKIIENHDAKIDIQSTVGEGSTFTVTIPRHGRIQPPYHHSSD